MPLGIAVVRVVEEKGLGDAREGEYVYGGRSISEGIIRTELSGFGG